MDIPRLSKAEIRTTALATRDALSETVRQEASFKLVDYAALIDAPAGAIVSGFFPIRSEIDVRPLMAALRDKGAHSCLPVVIDKESIEFRRWEDGAELVETGFGTYGPGRGVDVLDPDLMLIPLAAFDDAGNRIGYGAGFYDRVIARLHVKGLTPRLIGVAFDCQRSAKIPAEPHDVPLDAMLTENGLYDLKRPTRT